MVSGWCHVVGIIFAFGVYGMGRCAPVPSILVSTIQWTSLMWPLRRETLQNGVLMIKRCEWTNQSLFYTAPEEVWIQSAGNINKRLPLSFCDCFLIDMPAVGVAISLRLTIAKLLSEISGGCCLHSSSTPTVGRNGLLKQVCLKSVSRTEYSSSSLKKGFGKKSVRTSDSVCASQVQALPSTASVCPHHSVARALKMASCGSGLLIFLLSSWRLVST